MGINEPARDVCAIPEWYRGDTFSAAYDRLVTVLGRAPSVVQLATECSVTEPEASGLMLLLAEERGWL